MLSNWLKNRKEAKLKERLEREYAQELLYEDSLAAKPADLEEDQFLIEHLAKHWQIPTQKYKKYHNDSKGYLKENPVQPYVKEEESTLVSVYRNNYVLNAYVTHEAAGRGINLLVDALSNIDIDIKEPMDPDNEEKITINSHYTRRNVEDRVFGDTRVTKKKLAKLLNYQPNPYQSKNHVFSNFWLDFFLYGNAFLHFDGAHIYHLKAQYMEIAPHAKRYIEYYLYDGRIKLEPNSVIHIKDQNNFMSSYVGKSRLESASLSLDIMTKMGSFHRNFFKNGTILGLALTSPNVLSPKLKAKILANWQKRYNPVTGGRRPHILDGGLKIEEVGKSTFRDLDFDVSYKSREMRTLKALGVPPVLLESGNNANLSPNIRLLYELTVMPAFDKLISALEVFFGWDVEAITQKIQALQPEMADKARSVTTLVNSGIMTPNEARQELRLPKSDDESMNEVRIPANIAGSAVDPSQGGRPRGSGDNEEN